MCVFQNMRLKKRKSDALTEALELAAAKANLSSTKAGAKGFGARRQRK